MKRDLRKQSVEDVLSHVESSLNLRLDRQALVRKRRSLGACTDRGTWVRIEARPLAKIAAQGQAGNGMEAAALLHGIAKPAWFTAVSWHDSPGQVLWRADEVELVTAAPVRSNGPLSGDVELSDEWWDTLNTSLDNLARQHTTRVATPDTDTITQALVTTEINRAFPDQVEATVTDHEWVPAHADLNWANLTSPECWILDWEDHGLAPRGLDPATLAAQLPDRPDARRAGLSRATGGSGNPLGKAHGGVSLREGPQ
ncbi:MAG: hypothetical protein ACRDQ4_13240 [Pseudonocardiaceae bacterium]